MRGLQPLVNGIDVMNAPDNNVRNRNQWPSLIVTCGAWLTGIGLVVLGLQCLVFPGAADGYGVSPLDKNGFAYLLATGMRDLSLGLITIYLLLRFRPALSVFFSLLTIIPIADVLIVWNYGNSLLSLGVHLVGVVGLSVIAVCAFAEQRRADSVV